MTSPKRRRVSTEALSEANNVWDEEEREKTLELTRLGVANLGEKLCQLLVDFLFTMSRGDEELMQIFQHLRAKLEPRITEGRLIVVDRIFALIKTGEKDVMERTKHKKLKSHAEELDNHVCEMIDSFCDQIMSLEEILSLVLTRPVQSEVKLAEHFEQLEKEQYALKVKIRNLLVEK